MAIGMHPLGTAPIGIGGPGAIEGQAALVEANDSVAGAGALAIAGAATVTEAGDSLSGAGGLSIEGQAALTEAGDSLDADGALEIDGDADLTEASDSVAGSGALAIAGAAAITEAGDSLEAEGFLTERYGSAALVEADDSVAAAGELPIVGTAALVEAGDTMAAAGELPIVGAAAITEADDTIAAAGLFVDRSGAASLIEADDTLAGAGGLAIEGAAALAEDGDTVAAAGGLAIAGAAALTEAADMLAAAAVLALAGAAAMVEDDDVLASAGATVIAGTAAMVEDGDTLAATGTFGSVSGSADLVEDDDVVEAEGVVTWADIEPWAWRTPPPGDLAALLADVHAELRFVFEAAPYRTSLGQEQWIRFTSHPLTTGPDETIPNEELIEALDGFDLSSNLWSGDDGGRGVILGESRSNSASASLDNSDGALNHLFAVGPGGVREYHWARRPARCLVGHPDWAYDDHVAIWTGHVDAAEAGADRATLRLYDVLEKLDQPIQERVYLGNRWDGVSTTSVSVGSGSKTFVLDDRVTNGGFASDLSGWTAGTGWAQSGGAAVKSAGTGSSLAQDDLVTAAANLYRLRATVTRSAGSLQVMVDGAAVGDPITAGGTIDLTFTAAGSATDIAFAADAAFAGSIDAVTVRQEPEAEPGDFAVVASEAAMAAQWMWGAVASWDPATGELVVTVDSFGGSGSHSDWLLWLRADEGGPDQAGKVLPEPWGIVRRVEPDYLGVVQGYLLYRGAEAIWNPASANKGGSGVPIAGSFPPASLQAFVDTNRGLAWVSNDVTPEQPFTLDVVSGSGTVSGRRVWSQPGSYQFTVPTGVTSIRFKGWAAGGGGASGTGTGGGGAFVDTTIAVTPGETLLVVIGGAGRVTAAAASLPAGYEYALGGPSALGPGGGVGAGIPPTGRKAGSGGGASGLKRGDVRLVVVGAGAGAAHNRDGGEGGADGADGGSAATSDGEGATASAPGEGGVTESQPGRDPAPWTGVDGTNGDTGSTDPIGRGGAGPGGNVSVDLTNDPAGAGGGGYHGGGGGASDGDNGSGAGGGGSSEDAGGTTEDASGATPGGTSDPDWDGVAGKGGQPLSDGADGRVVVTFDQTLAGEDPTPGSLIRRTLRDRMGYPLVELDQSTLVSVAANAATRTLTFGASLAALGIQPWQMISLQGTSANAGVNLTVAAVGATTIRVREPIDDMGADTSFSLTLGGVDGTALAAIDQVTELMGHVLRDPGETGRNVADKLLGSLGWFVDATPGGLVTFAPFGLPTESPVAYLEEADGGDILDTPVREAAPSAVWRLSAGAEECYRVHSPSEISAAASDLMRQFVASQWRENDPRIGTDIDVKTKDLRAGTLFVPTRWAFRASLVARVPTWLSWFTPDRQAYSFPVGPRVFGLRQGQTIAIRAPSADINEWLNVVIVGRDASMGDRGGRLIVWR